MSWKERSDLGLTLVGDVHDALRIEDRWRKDEARGFQWWPSGFAQHIWADIGLYHNAQAVYRMHAETDLIKGRGHHQDFELALETAIDACTFSAIVYDAATDTFRLHSSVYASPENVDWLKKTFFAAAALQLAEAQEIATQLSRGQQHAVPAMSDHPVSGLRSTPDPMLQSRELFFAPQGAMPSRWIGVEEWEETERLMEREAETSQSDHQNWLKATFRWTGPGYDPMGGEPQAVLEVTTLEPHPAIGNGLHFTLTLPLQLEPGRIAHLALELNDYERKEWKRSHMLGSWCCHGGQLAFRCFLPNTIYNRQLLPNITTSMMVRAGWADEWCLQNRASAPEHLRVAMEHGQPGP
jgi:hypothetical protein